MQFLRGLSIPDYWFDEWNRLREPFQSFLVPLLAPLPFPSVGKVFKASPVPFFLYKTLDPPTEKH